MLNSAAFNVLNCLNKETGLSQREIAKRTSISLGLVNSTLKELMGKGLVDASKKVTKDGLSALEPYKVKNAIIMAAGLSSRFVPISFELPKGMLRVKGEILIERQISQLKEAGIDDITVVVGYKREEYFYLEDKYGVRLRINPDFNTRNNNSTIKVVEDLLDNTYICSSDNYFTENPFEPYVYCSYYSGVFIEGPTEEYCMKVQGKADRISEVCVGGKDDWAMLGHAYWDRDFSQAFIRILNDEYDRLDTNAKLWEDIFLEHVNELPMVMRRYDNGIIWEFDSLDQLRAFDPSYIENVDSRIMDNICMILGCKRAAIQNIVPIKQGLTNLSCRFDVGGLSYVYRHPGSGTDAIIDRATETQSEAVARKLDLDSTFIYEDPVEGWKISLFLQDCKELDYECKEQVNEAIRLIRLLHDADEYVTATFDLMEEEQKIEDLLQERNTRLFSDFANLKTLILKANKIAQTHSARRCLCHNDFYAPNILVHENGIELIDWEYSGMSDYASDLGTFICCAPTYGYDDAVEVITEYFGRAPTPDELLHCISMVAVAAFYWFVWALYKEACGEPPGEYLYLWYRMAKDYGNKAIELAKQL